MRFPDDHRGNAHGSWTAATCGLLVALLLAGCVDTGNRPGAPVGARTGHARSDAGAPELRGSTYTVVKGDTLYSIAFRARMDFRALAAANGIEEPYIIHPGQRLRLRPLPPPAGSAPSGVPAKPAVATPSRTRPGTPPATPARPVPGARPAVPQPPAATPAPPRAVAGTTPRFDWPAPGRVVQAFGGVNKGVDIAGRVGEPVLAAADGVVVYAGDGLRGYGNLLILKHGDEYLSAYGHNERLLVREGDHVKARQKIAEIGIDGSGAARLHFEVRRAGSPVDPLRYLPSK